MLLSPTKEGLCYIEIYIDVFLYESNVVILIIVQLLRTAVIAYIPLLVKKSFSVTKHCSWKVVSADTVYVLYENPPIWRLGLYLGWICGSPKSAQQLNAQRSLQSFHGAHSWWSQLPLAGLDHDLKEVRTVHVNVSKTRAMQLFSHWVSIQNLWRNESNLLCEPWPEQTNRLGNYKPVVLTRT